jgi:hypothetical protein
MGGNAPLVQGAATLATSNVNMAAESASPRGIGKYPDFTFAAFQAI